MRVCKSSVLSILFPSLVPSPSRSLIWFSRGPLPSWPFFPRHSSTAGSYKLLILLFLSNNKKIATLLCNFLQPVTKLTGPFSSRQLPGACTKITFTGARRSDTTTFHLSLAVRQVPAHLSSAGLISKYHRFL